MISNFAKNLKIHNSITNKKESFKPIEKNNVGMYVCGPTVYSNANLGNCRTFISFDLIFRYLKYLGYNVRYVRNLTDVGHLENEDENGEDKVSKKARLEKIEPMEVVQKYTLDFHDVLKKFNTLPPSIEPTASGHIIEQIQSIKQIIKSGYGYEVNGSVYFDIEKFNQSNKYGKSSVNSKSKVKFTSNVKWIRPHNGRVSKNFSYSDIGKKGIDISGNIGDDIYSAANGIVVYSGNGIKGYGNLIIIKHNDVFLSAYAHNQTILVKENAFVKKGQIISKLGDSDSIKPILHFQIRKNGKSIDPEKYIP